jgi:hypothetical protein
VLEVIATMASFTQGSGTVLITLPGHPAAWAQWSDTLALALHTVAFLEEMVLDCKPIVQKGSGGHGGRRKKGEEHPGFKADRHVPPHVA